MRIHLLSVLLLTLIATAPALAQREQPWKKQIALDAGLDFPGGDVSDAFNLSMGYGGAATFYYQLITRQTFLSLSVGYHAFSVDGSSTTQFVQIPLQAGIRYNFALTGFQPYVGFEFGIYLATLTENDRVNDAYSSTEFGLQPKAGFRFPLSPGFDFDASLKYHLVTSDASFSFVGVNAGVAYTID